MRSADDGDPEAEASLAEAGAPDDALARVAKARLALADRKMSG